MSPTSPNLKSQPGTNGPEDSKNLENPPLSPKDPSPELNQPPEGEGVELVVERGPVILSEAEKRLAAKMSRVIAQKIGVSYNAPHRSYRV